MLRAIVDIVSRLTAAVLQTFGIILVIGAVAVLVLAPLALANLPPPTMVAALLMIAIVVAILAAFAAQWKWESGSASPRKWPMDGGWLVPTGTTATLTPELDHIWGDRGWAIGSARSRLPWGWLGNAPTAQFAANLWRTGVRPIEGAAV